MLVSTYALINNGYTHEKIYTIYTHLFGNATNIDAGASEAVFLDTQHFLRVGGGSFGAGYAAGAAADDY